MLEHYHMSFLLTTENGNFLLYPIMFKNQILYKADGLHVLFRDAFLIFKMLMVVHSALITSFNLDLNAM